jgi:hypothetical protein
VPLCPASATLAEHGRAVRTQRRGESIFAFLHIFLASEKNKRILHFANSLQGED